MLGVLQGNESELLGRSKGLVESSDRPLLSAVVSQLTKDRIPPKFSRIPAMRIPLKDDACASYLRLVFPKRGS